MLAIPDVRARRLRDIPIRSWFLAAAAALWLAPAIAGLATTVWTTEQGAQGPLILATGLWILILRYRSFAALARHGAQPLSLAMLAIAAAAYLLASMIGALSLLCLASYAGLVAILYANVGGAVLRRLGFPLAYLLFLIPPPFFAYSPVNRGLKLWVATRSVDLLAMFGFDVASSGTALYVDQYELIVEAACSGLNSIVGLLGVGLLYVYVRHGDDWRYATALATLIVPLAILANLARVVVLLLLVHGGGTALLGTALHPIAGFVMFLSALGLLVAIDAVLRRPWRVARARAA